jgi:hypothetical protein
MSMCFWPLSPFGGELCGCAEATLRGVLHLAPSGAHGFSGAASSSSPKPEKLENNYDHDNHTNDVKNASSAHLLILSRAAGTR